MRLSQVFAYCDFELLLKTDQQSSTPKRPGKLVQLGDAA